MHHQKLNILDNFNITGRGMILVSNLEGLEENQKVNPGDTVRYAHKTYEITAIEMFTTKKSDVKVGLVVKEISNKELFCKLVSKEDSSKTMEAIKWRIRNRWWLRPWKKIQLYFIVFKEKFKK